MPDLYLYVKLAHILSATVMFGTGIGSAFFLFNSWIGRDADYFGEVVRRVVLADWLFTTPSIVIQFATGLYLALRLGVPFGSAWFVAVLLAFVLILCCWIPAVVIQIRVREMLESGASVERCGPLMRRWTSLGCVALALMLVVFLLMVVKPGMDYRVW